MNRCIESFQTPLSWLGSLIHVNHCLRIWIWSITTVRLQSVPRKYYSSKQDPIQNNDSLQNWLNKATFWQVHSNFFFSCRPILNLNSIPLYTNKIHFLFNKSEKTLIKCIYFLKKIFKDFNIKTLDSIHRRQSMTGRKIKIKCRPKHDSNTENMDSYLWLR